MGQHETLKMSFAQQPKKIIRDNVKQSQNFVIRVSFTILWSFGEE